MATSDVSSLISFTTISPDTFPPAPSTGASSWPHATTIGLIAGGAVAGVLVVGAVVGIFIVFVLPRFRNRHEEVPRGTSRMGLKSSESQDSSTSSNASFNAAGSGDHELVGLRYGDSRIASIPPSPANGSFAEHQDQGIISPTGEKDGLPTISPVSFEHARQSRGRSSMASLVNFSWISADTTMSPTTIIDDTSEIDPHGPSHWAIGDTSHANGDRNSRARSASLRRSNSGRSRRSRRRVIPPYDPLELSMHPCPSIPQLPLADLPRYETPVNARTHRPTTSLEGAQEIDWDALGDLPPYTK